MKQLKITFLGLLAMILLISAGPKKEKHVGLWKGVDESNEIGYLHLEESGYATFLIDNEKMGGKSFDMEGIEGSMKYEVDYREAPHSIDFVVYINELNMEIGRLKGIFKFDNLGNMTLCVNFEGKERPTEFVSSDTIVLEREKKKRKK